MITAVASLHKAVSFQWERPIVVVLEASGRAGKPSEDERYIA